MLDYLIAPAVILAVLLGWIQVQHAARRFAQRHPEFGPAREEGGGCGGSCCCSGETCSAQPKVVLQAQRQEEGL